MQRKQVTLLGFFIILVLVLIVYSIILFIPRLTLDYSESYVVYFEGALTGLRIGSPVTIRGIKVGQVTDFRLIYDEKTKHFLVPVFINFYRKNTGELQDYRLIDQLIREGLRAELHVENLLTGNAAIEIEIQPGSPGYIPKDHTTKYVVIPSVPDDEKPADLNQAINSARDAFESIKTLTESEKVNNAIMSFTDAGKAFTSLSNDVNNQLPSVTNSLNESMQKVGSAAYSVRGLSDYLTRHPESLITGKHK